MSSENSQPLEPNSPLPFDSRSETLAPQLGSDSDSTRGSEGYDSYSPADSLPPQQLDQSQHPDDHQTQPIEQHYAPYAAPQLSPERSSLHGSENFGSGGTDRSHPQANNNPYAYNPTAPSSAHPSEYDSRSSSHYPSASDGSSANGDAGASGSAGARTGSDPTLPYGSYGNQAANSTSGSYTSAAAGGAAGGGNGIGGGYGENAPAGGYGGYGGGGSGNNNNNNGGYGVGGFGSTENGGGANSSGWRGNSSWGTNGNRGATPAVQISPQEREAATKKRNRTLAAAAAGLLLLTGVGASIAGVRESNNSNTSVSSNQNGGSDNNSSSGGSSNGDGSVLTKPKIIQNGSGIDWNATSQAAAPSVVTIQVQNSTGQGEGSGVIYDKSGHIVTNNHVVALADNGGEIQVNIGNRAFPAKVVGTDAASDLAVIKINPTNISLSPISFADSSKVKTGDDVMAVGSPLGLSNTATTGIVSALQRPVVNQNEQGNDYTITNAIQTSAPINPGNSGGALVNKNGQLIGINSSIATLSGSSGSRSSASGSIGIGFAISSNSVKSIVQQILSKGKAEHAYLGITPQASAVSGGDGSLTLGVKITGESSGSPAAKAGLGRGDMIVAVNGQNTTSPEQLIAIVRELSPNQKAKVSYIPSGEKTARDATVTLAAVPSSASN